MAALRGAGGRTCRRTNFRGADLRYASLVKCRLEGARLVDVQVYGASTWAVTTDESTEQDLVVVRNRRTAPLRTNDLHTAQLLALMLDGSGVRQVLDTVTSKLVLLLGSFAPAEKSVLDALRADLQRLGYVAVLFDFERPSARDYAETVVVLAGLSRFVVADFTNAKEVRSEILDVRRQYRFVPVVPIARSGIELPLTLINSLTLEDIDLLVRYDDVDDLLQKLPADVVVPAESHADQIAVSLARAQQRLRGV
ncbi:pentapeptide repeat-containing protein [Blastococcus sp. PRF04-17]|uniref:pentapeptide repeat-containing protein n=1 Tax=Blastococcus sp. PRF04-17 TaxID=2933797 RepID=UPI001FF519FF|nr:pentapeptide repeat-containing protein [Blastococcus sp. PRF04-17]UOY00188.1 pentapeptide repeat-containing protein [Blastococcus sp. PRF04-17]